MITIIDPPSGWKYGFPKPLPKDREEDVLVWLVEQGYPQSKIDELGDYFICRYWEEEEKKDVWSLGLKEELDKLPYTKHLDDGQYNDGKLVGFELGASWAYDKVKETLYTEEQIFKMFELGMELTPLGVSQYLKNKKDFFNEKIQLIKKQ